MSIFRFFNKAPEENSQFFNKVIPLAHSELTLRFNRLTGEITPVSFTSPLIAKNVYPKCWIGDNIDRELDDLVTNQMDLNNIIRMFYHIEVTKNSEVYRKLYRGLGYSLSGYYEVFYWGANNPQALV